MIKRFVKLEIHPKHKNDFLQLTSEEKNKIIDFNGCSHLEILQDHNNPNCFFTISHWNSEDALNMYRSSDFFRGNWTKVKKWFVAKPEAWSTHLIE